MIQVYTPNIGVAAKPGWCLKYVDDAGNAPARTATAKIAYTNEKNAGRIRTGEIPENVWVVGFLSFNSGIYVAYGHVFFIKRTGATYVIRDSESNGGVRGVYGSIQELLAWFRAHTPAYLGWSTHCDGREYARESNTTGGTTVDTIKSMYLRLMGREADQGGINHYTSQVSKMGWEFVYNDMKNSTEGQRDWQWRNPDRVRQLEKDLAAKPKEVVKEVVVEKVVEKPVEVVKEVEVIKEIPVETVVTKEVVKGDEDRTFGDLLSAALKKLFKIK